MMTNQTLSGDLSSHATSSPDDPLAQLIEHVRTGQHTLDDLDEQLPTAELVVHLDRDTADTQVMHSAPDVDGVHWLPVYTSPAQLAATAQQARSHRPLRWGSITGRQVLDEVLPGMPQPAGLVLNPATTALTVVPATGQEAA